MLIALLLQFSVGYAFDTLNIIMLIHPFEAIKHWQAGPPII
jgi:hypothetical protein